LRHTPDWRHDVAILFTKHVQVVVLPLPLNAAKCLAGFSELPDSTRLMLTSRPSSSCWHLVRFVAIRALQLLLANFGSTS